ncbi:MAG: CotH kinase family protein [Phycisphaerae bacterium]|nr:CotH kinase family protein [Phycisphaerae bacterium]
MTARALVVLSVGAALWGSCMVRGADLYDESALPVLHLQFTQWNWYALLLSNYSSKTDLAATLTVDGVVYEGVGVRFRGNTSYMVNSEKKSFNLSIDYTLPEQRLMGYKTLNLINCNLDATFMREVLYSNTCRQVAPSAKANFVVLEINGENWGVYANIQQLNAQFLDEWFASNDGTQWRGDGMRAITGGGGNTGGGTTGGGTVRRSAGQIGVAGDDDATGDIRIAEGGVTSGSAALIWLGATSSPYQTVYELKRTSLADPWASLIHVCDVLNNTTPAELPDKLEPVLNVDGALWICAMEIIFQDEDGYVHKRGSDYGLYYEPETGRIHLVQYDGNESMGNSQWSVFYRADDSSVPLMYRLMSIPRYRQRYLAHVRTILNAFFTEDALFPQIEAYRGVIDAEVQADTKKLYTYSAFTSGIATLKSFITNRRAVLLANTEVNVQSPQITSVEREVIELESGESIVVTARLSDAVAVASVQLFVAEGPFALFLPVSMADLGVQQRADGSTERVFSATLSGYPAGTVVRYYVQATAADNAGTLAFNPETAEHGFCAHVVTCPQAPYSGIVFNELMSKNVAVLADPQGEYDDWIELKNIGEETIRLGGMYLSDDANRPLMWRFPDGTELGPGEYLLVWADEDGGDEPGLHANFKLSAEGETVWLFDTLENGHALLDSVTINKSYGDQSCGRYPDGIGLMQVLSAPTPWGENAESRIVNGEG